MNVVADAPDQEAAHSSADHRPKPFQYRSVLRRLDRAKTAQNQNAAPFYSYNPNSVPTEQEPVQSGSYPSYANTDDTAAENNSAPSEEVNSEVDEYYHPTVQSPEANDESTSVEVQDNENEQQPLDENTDINE